MFETSCGATNQVLKLPQKGVRHGKIFQNIKELYRDISPNPTNLIRHSEKIICLLRHNETVPGNFLQTVTWKINKDISLSKCCEWHKAIVLNFADPII